jgi:hypothetical protein
MTGEE